MTVRIRFRKTDVSHLLPLLNGSFVAVNLCE